MLRLLSTQGDLWHKPHVRIAGSLCSPSFGVEAYTATSDHEGRLRVGPVTPGLSFALGRAEWALTTDLFNVFGSNAVIANNLTVNDQVSDDPTSQFGAPSLRVSPRALRLGSRLAF